VEAHIREANVMPEPKQAHSTGVAGMNTRKEYAGGYPEASPPPIRSRSILIMAGGTGGHIFGYDVTRAARALVSAENVAEMEVPHV